MISKTKILPRYRKCKKNNYLGLKIEKRISIVRGRGTQKLLPLINREFDMANCSHLYPINCIDLQGRLGMH